MSEERGRFRIVYAAFTKFFGSTCLSAVKIGTVSGRNYAEARTKLDKIENVVAFTKIAVDKRGRITVQERMNKFFPAGLPSPASGRTPSPLVRSVDANNPN